MVAGKAAAPLLLFLLSGRSSTALTLVIMTKMQLKRFSTLRNGFQSGYPGISLTLILHNILAFSTDSEA